MSNTTLSVNFYLILRLGEVRFGVDARLVQEVIKLPAISPLEEVPPYLRGLVNMRGKVIPVMDLNLRLGRRPPTYKLSDVLVILQQNDSPLGIIVHEIIEVLELPIENIEPLSDFSENENARLPIVNAVARTDDGLILLLDRVQLFHFTSLDELDQESIDLLITDTSDNNEVNPQSSLRPSSFFHGTSEEEQKEFKNRAQLLQKPLVSDELDGSTPLAIIRLANEYLAVELDATENFAVLARLTPIPCCPAHIMGSMNLRGDNLTLVDIRGLLNIPHADTQKPANIMVIKCHTYSVGISIDEVVDIVYLHSESINKMPAAIDTVDRKYLKGMVTYGQQMLAVVDIPKLLARPELTVNEEI